MATKIILPHGGYRNLLTYKKSDVIYQGTVVSLEQGASHPARLPCRRRAATVEEGLAAAEA